MISSKSQTSVNQQTDSAGYSLLTAVGDIEDKILPESQAALLLITQKEQMDLLPVIE